MSSAELMTQNSSNPYFETYTDELTTRLYAINKFNSIQFDPSDTTQPHTYRPNTNINLGFGFNYRGFGLNFAFNFPSVNNDDHTYGTTHHANLDFYTYLKKLSFTGFLEYYRGYYLSKSNSLTPEALRGVNLQTRSDISFFTVGLNGQYLLNHKKVSMRAAFTQDAWQKRSGGSFLIGGFLNFTSTEADSSLGTYIDKDSSQHYEMGGFNSTDMGPIIGYIHTFVAREHWFFTLAANSGFGMSNLRAHNNTLGIVEQSVNVNIRFQGRVAIGYNSRRNYIGFSYVNDINRITEGDYLLAYNMGQFRINFVHRFDVPGLGFVDKIMDAFPYIFLPLGVEDWAPDFLKDKDEPEE